MIFEKNIIFSQSFLVSFVFFVLSLHLSWCDNSVPSYWWQDERTNIHVRHQPSYMEYYAEN